MVSSLKNISKYVLYIFFIVATGISSAHGGRLDGQGCHNKSADRTYHCHRGPLTDRSFSSPLEAIDAISDLSLPNPPVMGTIRKAQKYVREEFMSAWSDDDGDCQNLRHELLIEHSLSTVSFSSSRQCIVTSGTWLDPYRGEVIKQASNLDVDHVVPLSYAFSYGAADWSSSKKAQFSQDPINLLLVSKSANRSKGGKGPAKYMPQLSFHCSYTKIWLDVLEKYTLNFAEEDYTFLLSQQSVCSKY